MNRKRKNRLIAIVVTLSVHLLIFCLLLLLEVGFTRAIPSKTKEITLVPVGMYGRGIAAGGGIRNKKTFPHPMHSQASSVASTPSLKEEMVAQDNNNPSLEEQIRKDEIKAKEKAEAKKREQEQKQREIDSRMAGAFGKGDDRIQRNDAGSGTSGSSAVGAGFSLTGRSIEGSGGLPVRPQGFPPTRGTIVVKIVVDSTGKVIKATTQLRGTSITDSKTLNASLLAARKTLFNHVSGAPLQEGTITYHFDVE